MKSERFGLDPSVVATLYATPRQFCVAASVAFRSQPFAPRIHGYSYSPPAATLPGQVADGRWVMTTRDWATCLSFDRTLEVQRAA